MDREKTREGAEVKMRPRAGNQITTNAVKGSLIGICAPVGWLAIDALFFRSSGSSIFGYLANQIAGDVHSLFILLYMLFGTSLAMGTFGALIGRKNMRLLDEEKRMSDTYKLFMQKEEKFEQRLFSLQNRMRGITKVSASIQASAELKDVFRLCADGIHDVLDFDRVNIFLVNRKTGMLECQETRGNLNEAITDIRVPLTDAGGILNLTIQDDRAYVVRGVEEMKPEYRLGHPYDRIKAIRSISFMLIPFHDGQEPVGLFAVDNKFKKEAINDEEVDIIMVLADQTSVAISNIRLINGIRRMDDLMGQAFTTIKDRRERYAEETQKLAMSTTSFRKSAETMTMDAEEMLVASDQEMKIADDFDRAGVEVANQMDELTSSMEEITRVVRNMGETLQDIRTRAEESALADERVKEEVSSGEDVFREAGQGIENLDQSTDAFFRTMEDLAARSEDVQEMVKVIDDVMAQTKLLALNASIIAAQAGSHGRSFAVVADEIGKLSRDVEGFTGKIKSAMDGFKSDLQKLIGGTGEIKAEVNTAVDNSRKMEGIFNRISQTFEKSHDISLSIRDETQRQVKSVVSVVETAEQVQSLASGLREGADQYRAKADIITKSANSMREISNRLTTTAKSNQSESKTLLQTVNDSEQILETLFVSLQEWRELGKDLLKELEAFGV
ncbi:methyl-accepting chemotaxis protein 3 [bacterium BMS3Abin14]|nr:methyl-accepting chemotaxis protein 3 [bacterium BMS3Abin14]